MITLQELNPKSYKLDDIQKKNIEILLHRMNQVRLLYNKAMIITSGVRTIDHQISIYKEKAVKKEWPFQDGKFDISKVPLKSMHLIGAACDVLDESGDLMLWCRNNEHHLVAIGLWIEDDPSTPRVHLQIYPPKSGNRFFKP